MESLPYVDVSVNDLVEFLFIANVNDAKIEMSMDGIENNKDMFMFCLDVFCKGLVILHGKGNKSVELDKVSMEDFNVVRKKMMNAGIDVQLEIDASKKSEVSSLNFDIISSLPDNLDVDKYHFEVCSPTGTYVIRFKLFHNA